MLYRSNKLMYDRGTNTLWHQFLGEPVVGPLANSGVKLEKLPVLLTTWGDWYATHPDTTVLDINTGHYSSQSYNHEWEPDSIYFRYREQPEVMFPVWQRNQLLIDKASVLGLAQNGQARAYPLELLQEQPVINDTLGGLNLVVVTGGKEGGARAYQRGTRQFVTVEEGNDSGSLTILVDGAGTKWRMLEEALVQIDDHSQRLLRLPSHVAYWFGWYAFNPDSDVYGEE